jgi:NADH:ubiquinone oxidoreductase subunit 2 (subunit N)
VEQGIWPLALVGLLASVVSVGYYLRVAQAMYGGEPALATAPGADLARIRYDLPLRIALGVTLAATLALGVAAVGWFPVVAG